MIGPRVTWRRGRARGVVVAYDPATQTVDIQTAGGVWTVAVEDLD